MAYNKNNYKKYVQYVISVYQLYKQPHVPDTVIVKQKFPEHGINISYRTWVSIKGLKPSEYLD